MNNKPCCPKCSKEIYGGLDCCDCTCHSVTSGEKEIPRYSTGGSLVQTQNVPALEFDTPTTPMGEDWEREFLEAGADLEHARWSGWQKHFFGKCAIETDEKQAYMALSLEDYERWNRQIETPYAQLSEAEKESDRREVRSYLPLIKSLLSQKEAELANRPLKQGDTMTPREVAIYDAAIEKGRKESVATVRAEVLRGVREERMNEIALIENCLAALNDLHSKLESPKK